MATNSSGEGNQNSSSVRPIRPETSPEECRAIVLWRPPVFATSESGNIPSMSVPEGGIAAEISISSNDSPLEDQPDLQATEDEQVPVGSGFI